MNPTLSVELGTYPCPTEAPLFESNTCQCAPQAAFTSQLICPLTAGTDPVVQDLPPTHQMVQVLLAASAGVPTATTPITMAVASVAWTSRLLTAFMLLLSGSQNGILTGTVTRVGGPG
jgi:hypothetical protein